MEVSNNWMLDETKKTIEFAKQNGINDEELIKLLTIQKIDYGKRVLQQFYVQTRGQGDREVREYFDNLYDKLEIKKREIK